MIEMKNKHHLPAELKFSSRTNKEGVNSAIIFADDKKKKKKKRPRIVSFAGMIITE